MNRMLSVASDGKEGHSNADQHGQKQEADKNPAQRPRLGCSNHKIAHARGTIPPTRKEVS